MMKGAGCAILVLSTLWRGAAAESPDRSTGEEFQDIAIQATRDMTVPDGERSTAIGGRAAQSRATR